MQLKDIIAMSIRNTMLFSKLERRGNHLIFNDENQPDKYYHNYINLLTNHNYTQQQIMDYYEEYKQAGREFVVFRIEEKDVRMADFTALGEVFVDENLYYVAKIDDLKIKPSNQGTVKKITSFDKDALSTMIYEGSKVYGVDYAIGNARRRIEILFSEQDYYHCYFIYSNEEIAGYIFTIKDENRAELDDFWIKEHYQKQGYGSHLLNFVVEDLKKQGVDEVFLLAAKEDTAQYMYEQMNFKLIGESKMIRKMIKKGD